MQSQEESQLLCDGGTMLTRAKGQDGASANLIRPRQRTRGFFNSKLLAPELSSSACPLLEAAFMACLEVQINNHAFLVAPCMSLTSKEPCIRGGVGMYKPLELITTLRCTRGSFPSSLVEDI